MANLLVQVVDLAPTNALITAVDLVVDAIRAVDVPAIDALVDTVKVDTADVRTDMTAVHDVNLPAVKTDTADVRTDMTAVHDADLPAVKTDTNNIRTVDVPAIVAAMPEVSEASATVTGVVVQDGATGTPNLVDVTSDAARYTFGAWATLDASVSADSWISHIAVNKKAAASDPNFCCLEIGTGAGGSETTKMRFSFQILQVTSVGYVSPTIFTIIIPIKVANGTRIAARISDYSDAAANVFSVGLSMYQSLEV